jgi:transcriptional regulator with XRE-family HTH domain
MATVERRLARGAAQADRIARACGEEIRLTRSGAGVSLRAAAESVGLSESQFGRIERGQLRNVSVRQLALATSAVGLKLSTRVYPDGDPVRDVGQLRLLNRFRERLAPSIAWRTEVPIPIPGDLRAWDAQLTIARQIVAVEAESRLSDVQALDRRIALKRRDSGIELVVLVVAETRGNRRRLAEHRSSLRSRFPLDTRAVLAALADGRAPGASGIVII